MLGENWHWFDGPEITYKINKDGFRMNFNFNDINLNNYFLSLGCSFAFGIGMPYDSLYTSLISKEFNIDAVLLANPGHGIDTFFYNFFVWIETYKKLPKFVLLGHTSPERKTFWTGDTSRSHEVYQVNCKKGRRYCSYNDYIKYETVSYFDYRIKQLAIKNFCKETNIPLIEFTGFTSELLVALDIDLLKELHNNKPLARDHDYKGHMLTTHPGYDYQENVVNYVKEKLGI